MDTKALRQKILDLAIRGKLVPQDPNDEPASVLLERIRAEKQQMVKDGKLKAKDIKNDTVIFKGDDNLHYEQFADGTVKCIEDEIQFELPNGWSWVRMNSVSFITKLAGFEYTSNIAPNLCDSGVPLFKGKNVQDGEIIYEFESFIPKEISDSLPRSQINRKCILTPYVGTIGNIGIHSLKGKFHLGSNVGKIELYNQNVYLSEEYTVYFLRSNYGYKELTKHIKATAQASISIEALRDVLLPVPPENEQKRIETTIREVSSLIEKIESDKEIIKSNIDKAKSKILDLAIRGKLVPQDPNDEPASVLLERIRAEKEELIKQGKIKRDKKESVIFKGDDNSYYEKIGDSAVCIDDELPFEIPDNWCWARLSSFTEVIMGSSPNSQDICSDSNYTEFHQGKIYFSDYLLKESNKYTKNISKIAPENSVLLCVRAPVGEVNITDREICIGRGLSSIHAYDKIQSNFLFYWLKTQKHVLVNKSTGSTFSAITVDTIKNILLPIPPITEQLRITQKILDLNSNIESIKASLR